MNVRYWTFNLAFRHPFTISKGTKTHQPTFVVSLEHMGIHGYGEAPAISYYNIPVERMVADLKAKKSMIEHYAFTEPKRFWHFLHHLLPENSFLVCALDMAAWDLYGKMRRQPLHRIWGIPYSNAVKTDYTIGLDRVETMIEKLVEKPWPIYKIKLGFSDDLSIIEAIRDRTSAVLRVDANAAWDLDQARERIAAFRHFDIELIEQPLAKDNWPGMKILFDESPIKVIADESCVAVQDVAKCEGYFHGINIKLTKCGGITPALQMIEQAKKLGMKVMMGSMNESSIGSAAIAHFLPQLDYVDADGPLLLEQDLAAGLTFELGKMNINDAPGLGITPTFPQEN